MHVGNNEFFYSHFNNKWGLTMGPLNAATILFYFADILEMINEK